jgi:hypothetical protein
MYLYIRVNVEGNRTIKFLIILHLNSLIPTINQDKWQYDTFNLIGISIKVFKVGLFHFFIKILLQFFSKIRNFVKNKNRYILIYDTLLKIVRSLLL